MTENNLVLNRGIPNIKKRRFNLKRNWPLYVMLLPIVAQVIIFNYIPMYGVVIAFEDFQPIHGFIGSPFVGLKWFKYLADMPDFVPIVTNTVVIAVAKLVLGMVATIFFALLLNEIRLMAYKRTIQTLVYLPHFLSWVIIGGTFIDMLSEKGIINKFIGLFGIESIFFLGSNTWFQPTVVVMDIWKSFGWGAIIYLAALAGVNPELYESAVIDGASRLRQAWHITLPGIKPTIVLLAVLNLGGILNAGFEQILILYNPAVLATGDIIDTFVYRAGLLDAQFSMATAVGFSKSVVGFGLTVLTYKLAYKFAGYRVF